MITHSKHIAGTRAFTLTEMLVVICIICILAALSFPALQRSLAQARNSACLSNLREIGLAASLYAGEMGNYPTSWNGSQDFEDLLDPYVPGESKGHKKQIFICPGAIKITQNTGGIYRGTYGINAQLTDQIPNRFTRWPEVILFADTGQCYPGNGSEVSFWHPMDYQWGSSPGTIADIGADDDTWSSDGWMRYRHNGGVNVVMMDGHSENLKRGTVKLMNLMP